MKKPRIHTLLLPIIVLGSLISVGLVLKIFIFSNMRKKLKDS